MEKLKLIDNIYYDELDNKVFRIIDGFLYKIENDNLTKVDFTELNDYIIVYIIPIEKITNKKWWQFWKKDKIKNLIKEYRKDITWKDKELFIPNKDDKELWIPNKD
jgi:hypothetical protein